MSQYDGSIRINTEISTKNAQVQLSSLENRMVKTADKVASLRSKMDALKDAKIPTQEYSEISAQIEKAEQKFNKLLEKQEQMQREGKDNGAAWDRLNYQIEEVGNEILYAKGELQELVATGKAFTLGSNTEEYAKLGQQLQYAENELTALNQKHEVLNLKQEKATEGYKKLGNVAKNSFNSIGKFLKKTNSYVNSFGKRVKDIAQKILPSFQKQTQKTNTVLGQFSTRLKSLLSGIFIFNVISAGFRKLFSGVGESFQNFYNYSSSFQRSVNSMRLSLAQFSNSIAAAFFPIVSVAIPYIEKLISYITKAVNSIGQLIAALLGKKTYTKAIRTSVSSLENTSSAFEEVEESAKEAEKAVEGYLSPLDEINKYSEDKEVKIDINTGKEPGVSDIGDTVQNMFEEVSIDSYFLDVAERIKNILSQFFAPLKEAWSREGKFVMDSWKYALSEIWNLIKSVGSDFLEVWQQEKTIKIFEDLLHIIGDIGLAVGNLAHNFREAWEENETGKRILEGIRDIIGVIVANIRHAADVTVEWSKNLNFGPLLTKMQGWIESLVPVFDNLSGVITDFYEKVLLPLGKWTVEKGLPDLLQVFIDFNDKVDWQALRDRLTEFWEHLEPFAETVGEGLIIFIERCADALADFINSPQFDAFLTKIEEWMDSVSPEDVADALENIAKSIIILKGALVGFGAVKAITGVLTTVMTFLSFFKSGGGAAGAAATITETSTAIGALSTALGTLATVGAGLGIVELLKDPIIDLGEAAGISAQQADYFRERYKGLRGDLYLITDPMSILTNGLQGLGWEMSNALGASGALETAMNNISKGMIYTDEKLSKMKENFGLTDDDIEMLRQSMLDANPALRDLADNFGLFDASVETLQDIQEGMKLIENGTITASEAFDEFSRPMWLMNDAAKDFFKELSDGDITLEGYRTSIENTSGSVQKFSDDINEAGKNVAEGLNAGMEQADTDTPAQSFFSKIVDSIKSVFGIHSPAENMKPLGENILRGVIEGFKSKISEFTEAVNVWWNESVVPWFTQEKWSELWGNIKTAFSIKWGELVEWWNSSTLVTWWNESVMPWFTIEKWSELYENIKQALVEKWNEIVKWWSETAIVGWWEDHVSPWFTIEKWEELLNNVPEAFSNVFTKVVDTVKEKIQSVVDWVIDKVDWLKEKVSSIKDTLMGGFSSGGLFGGTLFSTNTYSLSPAMVSLSNVDIPAYATGQVIPRAMKKHLAILGDNNRETEVVSPLSTIKQAEKESLLEVLSKLGLTDRSGGNSKGNIYNITATAHGKALFELMIEEGKIQQMSTGNNPFLLGTT